MAAGSKYWAFVSYSHLDRRWARWIQRAIETYRIPRPLVGREAARGRVPARLFPVFRGDDELGASGDLSAEIQNALATSANLIVLASPNAVGSRWVDWEIQTYRERTDGGPILCAVIDGAGAGTKPPQPPAADLFPPALRHPSQPEPLAVDLRTGKETRTDARLKLVAGLIGVGFDDLKLRDRRRRRRNTLFASDPSSVI